jgi:hypothetical protein
MNGLIICRGCGANLVNEVGVGWVDCLPGDDGGWYNLCPATDDPYTGHQPTGKE